MGGRASRLDERREMELRNRASILVGGCDSLSPAVSADSRLPHLVQLPGRLAGIPVGATGWSAIDDEVLPHRLGEGKKPPLPAKCVHIASPCRQ